jgi:hypothetical protein
MKLYKLKPVLKIKSKKDYDRNRIKKETKRIVQRDQGV